MMMASALGNEPDSMSSTPAPAAPPITTKDSATSPFHFTSSKSTSTDKPPIPPFLHVDGVPNFRDLGSYPCHPPSSHFPPHKSYITRPLTLFRSAQLTGITAQGTNTLAKDLKVRRLYDLRSEREISNQPKNVKPSEIDGVERVFVPVFRDQDYSPEGLSRKYKNYTAQDEEESHGYSAGFVRAYKDIFLNAGPAYKRIFEHIRDCDIPDENSGRVQPEPLLFHCAAGKDRTGVFAALVLRLCGVPDEVIAWEYDITKSGLGSWREIIIAHMMKGGEPGSGTPAMTREEAERAVGSRGKNMIVFLNDVVDRFGGVEKYMQEYCELSAKDVETIRRRLVVEGKSTFGDGSGYWKLGEMEDGDETGPLGLAKDNENGREREQKVMTG